MEARRKGRGLNMGNKTILDPCCGSRMFWFDKKNPNVIFADNRELQTTLCDGRMLVIKPDMIIDFRKMPFKDNTFNLVVFDPPHLIHAGENSWLAQKYGVLPPDYKEYVRDGFNECMRVLKQNGTLVFKWNEFDIPVKKIVEVIGQKPLYGHKSGKQQKTHWLCFMKKEG